MSDSTGRITVANLAASPFLGGPERQMLGLACALAPSIKPVFLCLREGGKSQPFMDALGRHGHDVVSLRRNYPHLVGVVREVAARLRAVSAQVLLTHGYKADIIGLPAARMAHIPVVMVSRGWTSATRRVRFYEKIDRCALRMADHVVCVSEGQARKVRAARVPPERVSVIRNAIDTTRFDTIDDKAATLLHGLFPDKMRHIVLAVGRLSPEKGFEILVGAAAKVCALREDVGFALIGEGPMLRSLQKQIASLNLQRSFILAGFRGDVDRLLPHASCLAQSSYTEGMPNVILEAMAASVAVVATDVGGTPELVVDGETGLLVPAASADAMAEAILKVLDDSMERARMGAAARERIEEHFTFAAQAVTYERLLQEVLSPGVEVVRGAQAVARA